MCHDAAPAKRGIEQTVDLATLMLRLAQELETLASGSRDIEGVIFDYCVENETLAEIGQTQTLQSLDIHSQTLTELAAFCRNIGKLQGNPAQVAIGEPLAAVALTDLAHRIAGGKRCQDRATGELEVF